MNDDAVDIDHPAFGTDTASGMPIRLGAAPNVPYRASPGLGQHTLEVVSELGFSDHEAGALAPDGVLGEPPDG